MTIEAIIAGLPAELRVRLERDAKRAKKMSRGAHLQDWMDYEVSFQGIRTEAMRVARTNQPRGRGYNEASALLMKRYHLDLLDKTSVTAVLWLTDPSEKYGPELLTRKQILDRFLASLTPQERSRVGSPITARQKVQGRIDELEGPGPEEDEEPTDPRRHAPVTVETDNASKRELARAVAQRDAALAETTAKLKDADAFILEKVLTDTDEARVIREGIDVDALMAENARLRQENAELRSQLPPPGTQLLATRRRARVEEKLRPFIKKLRVQAKKPIVEFSPFALESIAFDMEKLIDGEDVF